MVTMTKFCVFVSVSILFYSSTETFAFMKNLSIPYDFCTSGESVGYRMNFWSGSEDTVVHHSFDGELLFALQSIMFNLLKNSTSVFPNILVCKGYKSSLFNEMPYRAILE